MRAVRKFNRSSIIIILARTSRASPKIPNSSANVINLHSLPILFDHYTCMTGMSVRHGADQMLTMHHCDMGYASGTDHWSGIMASGRDIIFSALGYEGGPMHTH